MVDTNGNGQDRLVVNTNPIPKPRTRNKITPSPRPRSTISLNEPIKENKDEMIEENKIEEENVMEEKREPVEDKKDTSREENNVERSVKENKIEEVEDTKDTTREESVIIGAVKENKRETVEDNKDIAEEKRTTTDNKREAVEYTKDLTGQEETVKGNKREAFEDTKDIAVGVETVEGNRREAVEDNTDTAREEKNVEETVKENIDQTLSNENNAEAVEDGKKSGLLNEAEETKVSSLDKDLKNKVSELAQLQKEGFASFFKSEEKSKPEIVALHPKTPKKDRYSKSIFDSYTRKRGFQIGASLLDEENNNNSSGLSTPTSVSSALNAFDFVDEIDGLDVEMFSGSLSKNSRKKSEILNQLHGMHELESLRKNPSVGSLRSVSSLPGFTGTNMKKWGNVEELDEISLNSNGGKNGWVLGDTSDTGMLLIALLLIKVYFYYTCRVLVEIKSVKSGIST